MTANTFWGQAPEVLTVAASPSPTSTVFTVSSATNLADDQWIEVQVGGSGSYERTQIQTVATNALTVFPALSGAPTVPGSVLNSRELTVKSRLNNGGVFNAADVAELKAVDTTYAPNGLKYLIDSTALYKLDTGSSATGDDYLVIDPTTGPGRWLMQPVGGSALSDVAGDVMDTVPVVSAAVDFASMGTLTGASSSSITVPGARAADFVTVQPNTALTNGVRVIGSVTAKNTVVLQAFNGTGSTQDPASNDFKILVTTPNRIPPLTLTAITQYEALLNGDYNSTTLQTLLGDALQLANFIILIASRRRMQNLQDDATARSAISGSALANAAMEAQDGVGW